MAEVKISLAARGDLAGIGEFSAAHFGEHVADEYMRGFTEAFELLGSYPLSGEARPDYGKGERCKMHRSHRILYRISGNTVFVQRVLNHSQNVQAHLSQ